MFFSHLLTKTHHDTAVLDANLPDTYDPHHPESGATTAEYGMLAGGVVLGGGLIYELIKSDFFQELVQKIFAYLGELVLKTLEQALSGAIVLPSLI